MSWQMDSCPQQNCYGDPIVHTASFRLALTTCREAVSDGEKEEQAANAELQGIEGGMRDVRGRVEQRRTEASSLSSQGAVVKALLAAKASGDIPGIHGRLGVSEMHGASHCA